MDCKKEKNEKHCTCTYKSCPHHGICCDCVRSHLSKGEFPGCFFTEEGEKTWDRSWKNLTKYHR